MKTWREFYDLVLPDVPGCLPAATDIALRLSAMALCRGAMVWREFLDPVRTQVGQAVYDFEISSGQEVRKLLSATINGRDLHVLEADKANPYLRETQGTPTKILNINQREFRLMAVPDTAGQEVVTEVVLMPSSTATGVPDELFAQYLELIASGAKARLMKSPKKPYTDFNLAMAYQIEFDEGVAQANVEAFKGMARTTPRTEPHYF